MSKVNTCGMQRFAEVLVFSFLPLFFSVYGTVRQIKLTVSAFKCTINIAYRTVSCDDITATVYYILEFVQLYLRPLQMVAGGTIQSSCRAEYSVNYRPLYRAV